MGKGWENSEQAESGAEAGRFNQTNLITTGSELTALVALHDHTTT